MKKFIYILLACVGVVLLSVGSSLGYNHYVNGVDPCFTSEDSTISVQLENAVAQVINPTFVSVNDAFEFYEQSSRQKEIDAAFLSIQPRVFVNIAQVLIGREGSATKESIVEEFNKNYDAIYKHISDNSSEETATVPDESSAKPIIKGDTIKLPPNTTHDTVIDGKQFKLVKETKENG